MAPQRPWPWRGGPAASSEMRRPQRPGASLATAGHHHLEDKATHNHTVTFSDQPGAFAQPHLSCSHATSGAGEAQKTVTRTRNACKRIGSKCVVMSACLARRGERSDAHPQRRRRAGCSGGRRPAPASCAGSPWPPWRSCAAPTEHLHRTLHTAQMPISRPHCAGSTEYLDGILYLI